MPNLPPSTYTLEYPYSRTTGPVVGRFLTGLRDGQLIGVRCDGRVLCPPLEFHPDTAAPLEPEFVEVGPGGTVRGWTWIAEPTRKHPVQQPFAFALIQLDGADTTLVHGVAASGPEAMANGMRVRAQWKDESERKHSLADIYFVREAEARTQHIEPADKGAGPVDMVEHLISLDFEEELYPHRERFAQGLLDGKFVGQKSPASGKIYMPGKGYDPLERVLMSESDDVEVEPVGTVVSYTVITPVQYYGQEETEPYIRASILLDGTDQPLGQQDIKNIPADDFRQGLRLRAVFREAGERSVEMDNRWGGAGPSVISHWEPTGEPDVPFERLGEHS